MNNGTRRQSPSASVYGISGALKDLIETFHLLQERGVDFISLTEKIDTTTPEGLAHFSFDGSISRV